MIPFNKLLSTSLLSFLLQHNGSHTIQHSDESIYTEILHGDSSHNHVDATVLAYRNKENKHFLEQS